MLILSVCICIWLFIVSLSHPVSALLALNAESDIHCHVNIEFMTMYNVMYIIMYTYRINNSPDTNTIPGISSPWVELVLSLNSSAMQCMAAYSECRVHLHCQCS